MLKILMFPNKLQQNKENVSSHGTESLSIAEMLRLAPETFVMKQIVKYRSNKLKLPD